MRTSLFEYVYFIDPLMNFMGLEGVCKKIPSASLHTANLLCTCSQFVSDCEWRVMRLSGRCGLFENNYDESRMWVVCIMSLGIPPDLNTLALDPSESICRILKPIYDYSVGACASGPYRSSSDFCMAFIGPLILGPSRAYVQNYAHQSGFHMYSYACAHTYTCVCTHVSVALAQVCGAAST